ncbi:MAG: hypothetical protein IPN36_01785 [Bacteroidetes bacterium]|nr:hypothetical protein [Bacteroidota bacterium]
MKFIPSAMRPQLYLIIGMIFLLFSQQSKAQSPSFTYEAVYIIEEAKTALILKKRGAGFIGYFANETEAKKITGAFQDDVLTLILAEGEDKTASYAALDEGGNLLITDDNLNMAYFTRTDANVDEVIAGIEKKQTTTESNSNAIQTNPVDEQPAVNEASSAAKPAKGKVSTKYANKKFLHMYTGNGLSEKWAYYLYDDGRFYYKNFTTYMSNDSYSNFSSVMKSDDAGYWAVELINGVEYLNLNWNDGKVGQLKIQKMEVGYMLNNNKYFLVGHSEYE